MTTFNRKDKFTESRKQLYTQEQELIASVKKQGALAGIPEEEEKLEPCLWDTCVCWDEEEHRLRNK